MADGGSWPVSRRRFLQASGAFGVASAGIVGTKAWFADPADDHPWFRRDDPDVLVMAHGGGGHLWPNNTAVAFEGAADLGVDALEIDVHLTADGVPVCIHDATVDRRTDATGLVSEFALDELQALDGAYGWSPPDADDHPHRGEGLEIPTLASVFETHPEMRFVVELKPDVESIGAVCDVIRSRGMERQVMAASFTPAIETFRQRCPGVVTSAHRREVERFLVANGLRMTATYDAPAHAFQVPVDADGIRVLTQRFVEGAHDRGMEVHAWTINDPDEMARLVELGVDGLITDRPDLALDVLGRS